MVGMVERITQSPKGREALWVKFKGHGSSVSVGREEFTVHDIDGSILFARRQVPLTLAFATTAHRSMGLTLEGVSVRLPCNKDRAEKRSYLQDRLWEQSWLTGCMYTILSRVGVSTAIRVFPLRKPGKQSRDNSIFHMDQEALQFDSQCNANNWLDRV